MKLKVTSDRYNAYLKKVVKEPTESVSEYYFYGDKEDEGVNQFIYYTKHRYDSYFGEEELILIAKKLHNEGWRNIIIERWKQYYKRMKSCPVMSEHGFCIGKYKFIY